MSFDNSVEATDKTDIGDYLKVGESQQLEQDDASHEDPNDDEFADLSDVPDGTFAALSTADLDDEPYSESEDEECEEEDE